MSAMQKRWKKGIPDVLVRIVLIQDQDGGDLILSDSSSVAARDGVDDWVHSSRSACRG